VDGQVTEAAVHRLVGIVEARRIEEDQLVALAGLDAAHGIARRLRHGGHDGHLLAAYGVDEGRFTRRRPSYDGYEG